MDLAVVEDLLGLGRTCLLEAVASVMDLSIAVLFEVAAVAAVGGAVVAVAVAVAAAAAAAVGASSDTVCDVAAQGGTPEAYRPRLQAVRGSSVNPAVCCLRHPRRLRLLLCSNPISHFRHSVQTGNRHQTRQTAT